MSKRQSAAMKNLHALAEFRYYLRGFLNFSDGVAEEAGLHPQQYQLLQVVAAVPKDEMPTIAYVAARLYLRHNSTVELVNRTERQGLLKREIDADDHRKVLLRLTPRGKELTDAAGRTALCATEAVGSRDDRSVTQGNGRG